MLLTDLFDALATTKSPKDKVELLKTNDDWFLRFLLKEVYLNKNKIKVSGELKGTGDQFLEDIAQIFIGMNSTLNKGNSKDIISHQLKKLFTRLEPRSAELVRNVLYRDLKCGISKGMVNKAFPFLISEIEFPNHKLRTINSFPIYSEGVDVVIYSQPNKHDCIVHRTSDGWILTYKTGRVLTGFEYLNKSLDVLAEKLGVKSMKGLSFIGKLCSKTKDVSFYLRKGHTSTDVLFTPILVGSYGGFLAQDSGAFKEINTIWSSITYLHRLPIIAIQSEFIPLVMAKYFALGYEVVEIRTKDDLLGFKHGIVDVDIKDQPSFSVQLEAPCVVVAVETDTINYPLKGKLAPHSIIKNIIVRMENGITQTLSNGLEKNLRSKYADNASGLIGKVVSVTCKGYDENRQMILPTFKSEVSDMYWESIELFVEGNRIH